MRSYEDSDDKKDEYNNQLDRFAEIAMVALLERIGRDNGLSKEEVKKLASSAYYQAVAMMDERKNWIK